MLLRTTTTLWMMTATTTGISRRPMTSLSAAAKATAASSMNTSPSPAASAATPAWPKELFILRHGQATHNPRAEAAKAAGCSFDVFFELMRRDDSVDSPLTELGRQQAAAVYEQHHAALLRHADLVVSSPLSRALETANLALPPKITSPPPSSGVLSTSSSTISDSAAATKRICYEGFREINGVLKNAQRRTVTELRELFADWNFDELETEQDATWDADQLEDKVDCRQRGYQGFYWLCHSRPERRILLVAHGGILRYTLEDHPNVVVQDGRRFPASSSLSSSSSQEPKARSEQVNGKLEEQKEEPRSVLARFSNCELRRYLLSWDEEQQNIVLTEIDLDHDLLLPANGEEDQGRAPLKESCNDV